MTIIRVHDVDTCCGLCVQFAALLFSMVFTILSIFTLPGSWAESNDGLKEFTLREYCTRSSSSAAWNCTGYNAFNGSSATVAGPSFATETPEAADIAFGMAVVQLVFNVIGLFFITSYVMSLDVSPETPLGNVLMVKLSVLASTLAFIFGLVAMLSVGETRAVVLLICWDCAGVECCCFCCSCSLSVAAAGDSTFQALVWDSPVTKDLWHWGTGYTLNIVAWVGTLLLDCVLVILWSYAGEDDEEEDDDEEEATAAKSEA